MGLSILIKSRGHLRRNRLSEKGTCKGKRVVRKFMDFSICKAEVRSLCLYFCFSFSRDISKPLKSSHRSGIIHALLTQQHLSSWVLGQPLELRDQLLGWLTAPWLHPTWHSKQTNPIYSVNPACPGEFQLGDSSCKARLFRNVKWKPEVECFGLTPTIIFLAL